MDVDRTLLARELLARYAAIRQVTAQLIAAAEQEHAEELDALVGRRAMELDAVDALLVGTRDLLATMPDDLRGQVIDAARMVQELDKQLQILLSSTSQEIPSQLAVVRDSMVRLGGYHPGQPDRPEIVDRRG